MMFYIWGLDLEQKSDTVLRFLVWNAASDIVVKGFISHARSKPLFVAASRILI